MTALIVKNQSQFSLGEFGLKKDKTKPAGVNRRPHLSLPECTYLQRD
jgi:hypothetical protein